MKRSILLSLSILFTAVLFSQTTATNFTADDCGGTSHDLFTELDEGKVIVIAWVMPCGGCLGPSIEAFQVAQSYAISHPDKVLYYMADDYANTDCSQLSSWATANGMGNSDAFFSTSKISMSDYGTPGMPKVIVVGCSNHKVYYNENNTAAGIGDAIDEALEECSNLSVLEKNINNNFNLELFPNPTQNITNVSYEMSQSSDLTIDVVNMIGKTVMNISNSFENTGKHEFQFKTGSLGNGLYFLRINSIDGSQVVKFSVVR